MVTKLKHAHALSNLRHLTDGIVFQLGSTKFIAPPSRRNKLRLNRGTRDAYCPATLITLSRDIRPSVTYFQDLIQASLAQDDVYQQSFLSGIIINALDGSFSMSAEIASLFTSWGAWYETISVKDTEFDTPLRPVLIVDDHARDVLRLYEDKQGTFMVPFLPSTVGTNAPFKPLQILSDDPMRPYVAVPSRLTSEPSAAQPLAGVRIVVKDAYDLRGVRKTLGNRAFYDLAEPAKDNAPIIQRLIDAGAVILGTSKLSSMVSREEPTEAVDYQAPWNPRGDGYQSPAGSSSGSAAAVAAYAWLDFSLGSDTNGSSRRPAFVNGCFQLRLSQHLYPTAGLYKCFPMLDSPAFFSTDLSRFRTFMQSLMGTTASSASPYDQACPSIKEVIFPTEYFPVSNAEQMSMIKCFTQDLAASLDVNVKEISLEEIWAESPPAEAGGAPLRTYMADASRVSFFYDFYHASDSFRDQYWTTFGRAPYVNRVAHYRWLEGHKISRTQRDAAIEKMEVFRDWLLKNVYGTCDAAKLLILPIANCEPTYRDHYPGEPFAPDAWDPLWLSPIAGSPEISVPLGQTRYHSRISQREEMLPIVVSIASCPGSELELIQALETCFKSTGRELKVNTGASMFSTNVRPGSIQAEQ